MDRTKCKIIAADIEAAIQGVLDKHGLDLTSHKGKFSDVTYALTLNLAEQSNDESLGFNPNTEEARMWVVCAPDHLRDALGTTFRQGGLEHKIIGWRHRAPKRPILTEANNGKQFVFPVAAVVAARARSAK